MYKYCTAVCRKYSAGGPVLECLGPGAGVSPGDAVLRVPGGAGSGVRVGGRWGAEAEAHGPEYLWTALEVEFATFARLPCQMPPFWSWGVNEM